MSDFWKGRRVLVAGGAGLIGSHVVDLLLQKDLRELYVVDDLSTGLPSSLQWSSEKEVRFFYSDLTRIPVEWIINYAACYGKPWVIINLASSSWGLGAPESREHARNFQRTLAVHFNLWEFALHHGTHYVMLGSSCEGGADGPEQAHKGYGQAKRMIERHMIWHFQEFDEIKKRHGLIFGKIDCYNVFGPRENPKLHRFMSDFTRRVLSSQDPEVQVYGSPESTRNYIYADDCAKLILDNIEYASGSDHSWMQTHIVGENMLVSDMAKMILAALGDPREIIFLDKATLAGRGVIKKDADGLSQCITPMAEAVKITVDWIKQHWEEAREHA